MSLYYESLLGLIQEKDKSFFLKTVWYYNFSNSFWELDYQDSLDINRDDEPVEFEETECTIPKIIKFRNKEYLLVYLYESDYCTGYYASKDFILSQFSQ
jgi:hypothetical protein